MELLRKEFAIKSYMEMSILYKRQSITIINIIINCYMLN